MIKIIIDSTSTLNQKQAFQLGFDYLPYLIHINKKTYQDGIDITNQELIKAIKEGKNISTGTTSLGLIKEIINKASKNSDEVYVICSSSKLSSQFFNVSLIANKYKNVKVIDSKANGIIIKYLADAILKRKSIESILNAFNTFLVLPVSLSIIKSGRFKNIDPNEKFVIFTYDKNGIKKIKACDSIDDGFTWIKSKYISKTDEVLISTFDLKFKTKYKEISYSSTLGVHNGLGSLRVDIIKK